MEKKYFKHIDGLRAIAVLIVIIFHLDFNFVPGGFVGVDVFFVISGFLITGLLKRELDSSGTLNLKLFYIKRFKRLAPAFIITLLVTFLLSTFVFSPTHLQRISAALITSIFNISNIYFWLEADYFDISAQLKPFLHTWSLSIEWQFYFILPSLMFFFYKIKASKYFLPFLILTILVSLFLNYGVANGDSDLINFLSLFTSSANNEKSTLFYLLPFRIFEFSIGGALVWLNVYKLPKNIIYDLLLWIGLALIVYSALNFDQTILFPYWFALAPCLGAALIIYSGEKAVTKKIINNKIMVGIGLISYSLYLVHWPIIVFWRYIGNEFDFTSKIQILLLSVIVAITLYFFIEKPLRKPVPFSNKFRFVSFSTVVLLLIISLHANKNNGWEWRSDSSLVNLEKMDNAKDFHRKYYGGAGYPYSGPIKTKSQPDFIILGDSHGRHYAEGLFKLIAKPYHLSFYINSGTSCLNLPHFTRTTKGYDWNNICPSALKRGLGYIKLNKTKPPLVIISHSWNEQMVQADLLDKSGVRKNVKMNVELVIQGLLELKTEIGDSQLVVIGNVPRAGVNLYDIFTRPKLLFEKNFKPMYYLTRSRPTISESFELNLNTQEQALKVDSLEYTNRALKAAAEKTGKFIFIDPFDYLCDKEKCRNIDEEKHLIYSDRGHLSTYGSIFLVGKIKNQLIDLINER